MVLVFLTPHPKGGEHLDSAAGARTASQETRHARRHWHHDAPRRTPAPPCQKARLSQTGADRLRRGATPMHKLGKLPSLLG